MLGVVIYAMVFCGAALMVYNIYGFIHFAAGLRKQTAFEKEYGILYIPIILLILFLLGYLAVGIFGSPDLIVAGILFGGSIFVFIIYKLLNGITQRILERKELEAKLRASEEASRAKTGFLSTISHEMRTPLNVIMGLDNIALRSPDLPQDTRRLLEKIGLSAKHLLGMISNILDMNRIERGRLELHNEVFDLTDALEQIDAIVGTMCEEKGLSYESELQPGAGASYLSDVLQLKQVLLSILENAVKYTDAPGAVSLRTQTQASGESVSTLRFTISDTGIGMDADFLAHIFEAFSQEDASSTSRFGGSGLSLAVTKNIVDLMGGTVSVESEKGRGSVFTVTVPLRQAERSPEEAAPPTVALAGRRVLIVEDLPENAEIVQDLLELEDVETEHAENGRIALEMFERAPKHYYDAVLMDLRMPVMDGLEATRRIRALERPDAKTVPIIALTANAFESDVKNSLSAGMNAHLAKPTDAGMLYDTIKRHITNALMEERKETR